VSAATSAKRHWIKTAIKATVFLVVLAVTLVALAAAVLSFQGRREWARVKAELTARGEPLSLAAMWPPPIPDAQNFFADPLWMELADIVDVETDVEGQKVVLKQVRLPKGKRQIDALNRALTPDERRALASAFPEFPVSAGSTVAGLVRQAFKTSKSADRSARRRAAEFILAVTACSEPVLARLRELAQRPGARFPLVGPEFAAGLERTSYLLMYYQLLQACVWGESNLGDNVAAHRDVMTMLRLPDALAREPLLISYLVHVSLASLALEAVDGGLRAHAWNDAELGEIERRLSGFDFPSTAAMALRGERGFGNQFLEELHETPEGERSASQKVWSSNFAAPWLWIFGAGDEAFRNTMFQNWIDVLDAASREGLNARTFSVFDRDVKFLKENPWNRIRYAISSMGIPNLTNIAVQSARLQDQTQQIRTVCALERYRLKNGRYPDELASLVPDFLPAVPKDIVTLQPLRYRREGGGFLLWTPGWNETNQGGDEECTFRMSAP